MKVIFNPFTAKFDYVNTLSDTILVDTRDTILATTPSQGKLAYATDTEQWFIFDGTDWQMSPIKFGVMTGYTGIDVGALPYQADQGYTEKGVANKTLHNINIGGFNTEEMPIRGGAVKYDSDNDNVQVYKDGAWKNIISLLNSEIWDLIQWSDFEGEVADNGNDFVHNMQVDAGALPGDHILFGGDILNL